MPVFIDRLIISDRITDGTFAMYVLDYHRQLTLMQEMTVLRKNDEKLEVYYHHPSTNEMWKSYFPKAKGKKKGPKILRTEPPPERLEDRLKLCLRGEDKENAVGLGIELSLDPGKWDSVLDILDADYPAFSWKQLRKFFKHLGIFNQKELFQELDISFNEIGWEEKKGKQLAWRARKILVKSFLHFW